MKTLIAALCCCALLSQAVVAQETMQKKHDHSNHQTDKMANKDGKTVAKKQYMGCSKLVGAYVYGTDGESVGDINSITLDKKGNVQCAIVGIGGVAGVGETEIAVPWEVFKCDYKMDDGKRTCKVKLPMNSEQLEKAPVLKKEKYGDLYDQTWVETNSKFYGVKKVAKAPKKDSMMCVTEIAGLELSGSDEMKTAGTSTDQMTYTKDKSNAKSEKDEDDANESDLGTIEEVVIDLNDKKVCYLILGDDSGLLSEKHVAIPFEKVAFTKKDGEHCAKVVATPKVIKSAPKVTPGEYNELDQKSVRKQIKNSFTVQ